jgi:1-acyl-sn-glycerol-3-phosphate acyltransferase
MADKRYTSWHHWFFLKFFRMLLGPIFRAYYRFKRQKINIKKTGPYLILANHTAEFDIIFLDMLFDAPLYFVASDQLLNAGKGTWVLKTFFNPIPKSKSIADLALVKRMKSVIQEGGNIAIFPEGNASMHGGPSRIPSGIGRLIKFLNVPVKLIQVDGLYFSSPRWSYHRKFGPSSMKEITTLTKSWIDEQSSETIEKTVMETLAISAYDKPLGIYQGRRRAEGLHKLIFTCPNCSGLFSTYSVHHRLKCHRCSFEGHYGVDGYLYIKDKRHSLIDMDQENQQRFHQHMLRHANDFQFKASVAVATWEGGQSKRSKFYPMSMSIDAQGVHFKRTNDTISYPFAKIFSEAIQVRTKLILYPIDGPTTIVRFPKALSPYAILMVVQWYKAMTLKGEKHEFINAEFPRPLLGI